MGKELIAVISILEGALYQETKNFWDIFDEYYDARSVKMFEHPEVTFQGGYISQENLLILRQNFSRFAEKLKSFTIYVEELGRSGSSMIYFKVKKDPEISAVNILVNTFLNIFSGELIEEYLPENWQPHIVLAMNDLSTSNFERAWDEYGGIKYNYSQTVHNLYLVKFEDDGRITVLEKAKIQTPEE